MTDRAELRALILQGCIAHQERQDAADLALVDALRTVIASGQWDAADVARQIALKASDKAAMIWLIAECLDAARAAPDRAALSLPTPLQCSR